MLVLLLFFLARITPGIRGDCPSEASQIESRCYQLLLDQYDWVGATGACAKIREGSTPLSIETGRELDVLKPWLLEVLSNVEDLHYIWLYASDLANKGAFEWHHASGIGTYPMEFAPWAPNQPITADNYHCVDLNVEDLSFTFESYPCTGFLTDPNTGNQVPVKDIVICEYDP